jgi:DNA polymerase-3 subunit beta
MAQQDILYYLNGMLLVIDRARWAVATDGHRLSWASLAIEGRYERQEVILPRKTVLELGKLLADVEDPVTVDILANQVRFRFANVELTSKVVDGKFPDFNRVIPTGHPKHVELPRSLLLSALQRAAILSNEKFRGVRLVLAADQLKIICTNSEQKRPRKRRGRVQGRHADTSTATISVDVCRTWQWSAWRSRSATPIRARSSRSRIATTTSTS